MSREIFTARMELISYNGVVKVVNPKGDSDGFLRRKKPAEAGFVVFRRGFNRRHIGTIPRNHP